MSLPTAHAPSARLTGRVREASGAGVALRLSSEALPIWALITVAIAHALILLATGHTYFALPDNALQFWPWYQKAAAVLHSGSLPLWDLNTNAGHSFVGEAQTGVFYPLNLVWLLLFGSSHGISPRRLDMLVELHFLIASTGFYALARSFRFRRLAALAAAITFAYTGTVFNRAGGQTAIFFGLTLIPWATFFVHRQLVTHRLLYGAAAGACVGLAVLAGHFQPPFHAFLIVLILYLVTGLGGERRAEVRARVSGLLVMAVTAVIVAGPQLVYSLPYLGRAYRWVGANSPVPPGGSISFSVFAHAYSGSPQSFLSMLNPQSFNVPDGNSLYLGLGALVVLALVLSRYGRNVRWRLGPFWWSILVVLGVGILGLLGPWTFFPRILYALPLVSEVRQLARYSIMIQWALCLLLACGLDVLAERWVADRGRRTAQVLLVIGALIALNGLYLWLRPVPGNSQWFGQQLVLAGLVCGALGLAGWREGVLGLVGRRGGVLAFVVPVFAATGLTNGFWELGRTSSPLYPAHVFASTPALRFTQRTCAGNRTLLVGNVLPSNLADVYRNIETENGYGATMQASLYDFITHVSPLGAQGATLLDLRCLVANRPLKERSFRLAFADQTRRQFVYVDRRTSPVVSASLTPVPVQVLANQDRAHAFRLTLARPTQVYLSEIVYPGWVAKIDGHQVKAGAFEAGRTPVFPELDVPAGTHTVSYSWSGWPS